MRNRRGMRLGLGEGRPRARPPSSLDVRRDGKPLSRAAPPPRSPGPPGSWGQQDSQPSAAPAGPSFCCPGALRQVTVSQVSGRKWRPGPAGANQLQAQVAAGGGGRLGAASVAKGGSAAPPLRPRRRCALQIRLPGGRRRAALILPRTRPLPGPRPALLLKGASPRCRRATHYVSQSTCPSSGSLRGSEESQDRAEYW